MAPLTPATLRAIGFQCIGRDEHGFIVFHRRCFDLDGFWRVVYPGRLGDTPVFIGNTDDWELVDTLRWPVLKTREGVYLLPRL
jgi:hypothetical protein